jgi:hypothetical protein
VARSPRDELTVSGARLYVEQLAVLRVLGERDAASADPQVSSRSEARDRRTAERLERQPNLAGPRTPGG